MQTQGSTRPFEILLIDHNASDASLTEEALKRTGVDHNLARAVDGVQALAMLAGRDEWANAPRPDLILLELHLPKMNGQQVLGKIKRQRGLRRIPVIALTESSSEKDVIDC